MGTKMDMLLGNHGEVTDEHMAAGEGITHCVLPFAIEARTLEEAEAIAMKAGLVGTEALETVERVRGIGSEEEALWALGANFLSAMQKASPMQRAILLAAFPQLGELVRDAVSAKRTRG